MSKSSLFFQTLPGQPLSLNKSPDSEPPLAESPGLWRAGTGVALATAIKLMSCIGLGTRQWQLGRQPGPGPGPRRGLSRPSGAPPGRNNGGIQVWPLPLPGGPAEPLALTS